MAGATRGRMRPPCVSTALITSGTPLPRDSGEKRITIQATGIAARTGTQMIIQSPPKSVSRLPRSPSRIWSNSSTISRSATAPSPAIRPTSSASRNGTRLSGTGSRESGAASAGREPRGWKR